MSAERREAPAELDGAPPAVPDLSGLTQMARYAEPPPTREPGSTGPPGVEPPMLYARSADLVAVAHAAFIAFLLVGGFVAWRRPRLAWFHLPALAVTAAIFSLSADCPLTDLEKYLRRDAGQPVYRDGFIAHYLLPMVPDGVRAIAVPVVVVAVTTAAYAGYLARRRRAATGPGPGLRRRRERPPRFES